MDRRSFLGGLLAGVPLSLASLGRAEALARRAATNSGPTGAVAGQPASIPARASGPRSLKRNLW